jgi:hypothetical protein
VQAARNSFAVTFLLIRNIWFPLVSFHFWKDSLNELKAPTSPQSKALVITVCAVNIVMVALQFHWGSLIVRVRRLHACPYNNQLAYAKHAITGLHLKSIRARCTLHAFEAHNAYIHRCGFTQISSGCAACV